jgi:hypothetical protein
MTEEKEKAHAKYGKHRTFPCDRKVEKVKRAPSTLEAHTKAVQEKRFQRLQSNE